MWDIFDDSDDSCGATFLPIDRFDPNLSLYLPLWYPHGDMTGSTIYSYDKNRHAGTVYGATWGIQGRSFDGDDIIVLPTIATGSSKFTMGGWFKFPNASGINYGLIGGEGGYAGLLRHTNGGFSVGKLGATTGSNVAYTIPINTFLHVVAVVQAGNSANIYVNGGLVGTSTVAASYTLGNHIVNLGAAGNVADIPLTGTIGEVLIVSRDLSLAELTNHYLATKWGFT